MYKAMALYRLNRINFVTRVQPNEVNLSGTHRSINTQHWFWTLILPGRRKWRLFPPFATFLPVQTRPLLAGHFIHSKLTNFPVSTRERSDVWFIIGQMKWNQEIVEVQGKSKFVERKARHAVLFDFLTISIPGTGGRPEPLMFLFFCLPPPHALSIYSHCLCLSYKVWLYPSSGKSALS